MRRPTAAGLGVLLSLAAVAALSPLLAGRDPILVADGGRLSFPALRAALRPLPGGGAHGGAVAIAEPAWVVMPPVKFDPLAVNLEARLRPPGTGGHWLGTDELGRDTLSRLIHGARPSLLVAVIATLLSLVIGIPIGAAAGYAGRGTDLLLSRLIDASMSFPGLILLLLFSAIAMGTSTGPLASLVVVGCAVGVARWGVIARYMRAEVQRLTKTDMALAARASGASSVRILARHLIPAGLTPVAVSAAFGAGTAVVAEASLSFLGLGIQPPAPTWGQMVAASGTIASGHWWMLVFPGAMVAVTVAAFNMLGEGLRSRR